MPGGRLTRQERQQIELGLADGDAYAEIARRLGRPTSTVTREVMRNGGPTAYRAALAHRATELRARRRGRAAPGARRAAPPLDAHGRDPEAVREFEEAFTARLTASGLTPMMARVMSALCTTDQDGMTASDLVQRLQVSPASVSKAIAFLARHGFVRRTRGEGRRERYYLDDGLWYESMLASIRANQALVDIARQGVAVFGPGTVAGDRLAGTARALDCLNQRLLRATEETREALAAESAGSAASRQRAGGQVPSPGP
jgi:hypothetical protein